MDKEKKTFKEPIQLPDGKGKTPSFRVPYNLMEMQSQYKEELIDEIILGIDLSVAEDRHLITISKLLHDKSENKDQSSPNFYLGNNDPTKCEIMELEIKENEQLIIQGKMPKFTVSQREYYKAYLNGKEPGGNDIKGVNQCLNSLAQKSFALRMSHPVGKDKKGNTLYDYYEGIDRLFSIVKVVRGITQTDITKIDNGNTALRNEKGEFIFSLHPIFRHAIENSYVSISHDFYERMVEAAGGKITPAIIALRNYLLLQLRRIKKNKPQEKDSFDLDNKNLYSLLRLKGRLKKDKKDAIKSKNKTIQTFINLGLLIEVKEDKNVDGQMKHIFILNKDFS